MFEKYKIFIKGISLTSAGRLGMIFSTSAFISFILFELLQISGILTNAYIGLITYLLFPALFIFGLILIPIGWYLYRKKMNMSTSELMKKSFGEKGIKGGAIGSLIFRTVLILTLINVLFIVVAGFSTLKFMDQSKFCGTACHQVMGPEWTTYQASPHARVKCVECHVGEGVSALIDSKLSGLRQMWKSVLNSYERPVPTPVHNLRPSRETCEKCHWPAKFYGHNLKVIRRYGLDKDSTLKYITLDMKIDTGKEKAKAGIHWHIAAENEVRYVSVNEKRLEMLWVEVKQKNGSFKRFSNSALKGDVKKVSEEKISVRTMDCVDCHNRATHIYEEPEKAVDKRISKGQLDRSLPFAKRVVLAAITSNYPDKKAGLNGISKYLNGYYRRKYPDLAVQNMDRISGMTKAAQEIYSRNVHPVMKVEWGTYPSFLGHKRDTGCFRCHNNNLKDEDGKMISFDCTLCHSILSYGEDKTFKYMELPDKKSPNYKMHKMLREEFLNRPE